MAKYGISKEGADSMRNLASSLQKGTDDIREGGNALRSEITGIGEGLGEQAVETLISKANNKAADIESLVSAGLA